MSMHFSPPLIRRVSRAVTLAAALALLAGCGTDIRDRTEGGAATGAATGATIGLIGGPFGVIAGGLIGGGAGALTGATTKPSTVDLGEPVWSGK
jgi:hypothetical protein